MKKILIIGATSNIAEQCARIWASEGHSIFLAGRDEKKLKILESDLKIRGSKNVSFFEIDITNFDIYEKMLDTAESKMGDINIVLIAHGILPVQKDIENDISEIVHQININAISTVSIMTSVSKRLINKKSGTIAVISSVAGDRGRASNYIYGSTKAMVSTFASGLRQRLHKNNISVVTIKPGFVDTPMTKNYKKNFLWSKSSFVAYKIVKAIENKKDEVYIPAYWGLIMFIIKFLPNFLFKKIKL